MNWVSDTFDNWFSGGQIESPASSAKFIVDEILEENDLKRNPLGNFKVREMYDDESEEGEGLDIKLQRLNEVFRDSGIEFTLPVTGPIQLICVNVSKFPDVTGESEISAVHALEDLRENLKRRLEEEVGDMLKKEQED